MEWTPQTIVIYIMGLIGLVKLGVDATTRVLNNFSSLHT